MNSGKMEKLWQISVLLGHHQIIEVTVPENCTTAELYDKLTKHGNAPRSEQYTLTCAEGQLEISSSKRLSDYDIVNKGNLYLTVRLDGGVWSSVSDLQARPRLLEVSERMQITTSDKHPDVFGLDDDSPRAIMTCGHAVAPLSLALHCYHELEKGEDSIKCPDPNCGTRWKFSQIREAACLSADESHEFERKALLNKIRNKQEDIKSCPKCSTFCTRSNSRDRRIVCSNCTTRSGLQYEFCWMCLRQWNATGTDRCGNSECVDNDKHFPTMVSRPLKELSRTSACPKCFILTQHAERDKRIVCFGCKYEFCFICRKPHPGEPDAWETCDVEPRQTSAESPQSRKETWQLFVIYEKRFFLSVAANCFVDELFRTLYNHPMAPKVCGYRVIHGGVLLDNRERMRLSEYGIQDHSTLELMIGLTGG